MLLHGTGGSGRQFLSPQFAEELFGPGQPLYLLFFVSMMYGPQAALFAELFPKSVRYSGASLGYQIGAVVGGGLAPIIATALFAQYASSLPISIYQAAICAISFFSVVLLGRRMTQGLDD